MLETIALYALVLVPPPLLFVAWVWLFRAGQTLRPARRNPFLCGLVAATISYFAQFIVFRYWPDWPEATVLGVVQVMLISALASFATSFLGRGFGRISSCSASVLVFATWWLKGSP